MTFGRERSDIVQRNLRIQGGAPCGGHGRRWLYCAGAVPHGAKISVLMLDADGRIDRDFIEFFNQ